MSALVTDYREAQKLTDQFFETMKGEVDTYLGNRWKEQRKQGGVGEGELLRWTIEGILKSISPQIP